MLLTEHEKGLIHHPFSNETLILNVISKAPLGTCFKQQDYNQVTLFRAQDGDLVYSYTPIKKTRLSGFRFCLGNLSLFKNLVYLILPNTNKKLTPKNGTKAIINISKRRR